MGRPRLRRWSVYVGWRDANLVYVYPCWTEQGAKNKALSLNAWSFDNDHVIDAWVMKRPKGL